MIDVNVLKIIKMSNGQSAAKPLVKEEGSTTIETL